MNPRIRFAVIALVLLISASATPALAIFACQDCDHGMPPGTRCMAVCNGELIRFCTEWFASSCASFAAAEPETRAQTEEDFIRSLARQAAEEPPAAE